MGGSSHRFRLAVLKRVDSSEGMGEPVVRCCDCCPPRDGLKVKEKSLEFARSSRT